ncbi:MAG: hypothetical protein HDS36_00840 [Bacteroides sp.]|nr:hypothetical protein [Bacteroides sp.]
MATVVSAESVLEDMHTKYDVLGKDAVIRILGRMLLHEIRYHNDIPQPEAVAAFVEEIFDKKEERDAGKVPTITGQLAAGLIGIMCKGGMTHLARFVAPAIFDGTHLENVENLRLLIEILNKILDTKFK